MSFKAYTMWTRRHLIPTLGRHRLEQLTALQVQTMLNRKHESGLSPRSVHHLRAVLRTALNCAMRWGLVTRNAAELAEPPRIKRAATKFLHADDAKQLLDATRDHRLHALIVVGAGQRLRLGEALGLQWADIDLAARSLRVAGTLQRVDGKLILVEPKSVTSRRSIPMTDAAVVALRRHRQRQREEQIAAGDLWNESEFVFTGATGKPLDASTVQRQFQRMLRDAGMSAMRFHGLRHSCASLLMAQGISPRVVADFLGHSSISLTLGTYSHASAELLRGAADALDHAFGKSVADN
ncbi:MAG: site-specific integrase [Candidatus Dormibacteria bacterium]